jgi:hypothetical protein
MTEQIMSQAIADYIIDVLGNTPGPLDAIKVFIRGALPSGLIRDDQYPLSEVIVTEEIEGVEMTGVEYGQTYMGVITFAVTLAREAGADQFVKIGERVVRVPSYDLVKELIHAAVFELQKRDHRDMGSLSVADEVVIQFTVTGPRIFGIDRELRSNNWENFGVIPFEVETERVRL